MTTALVPVDYAALGQAIEDRRVEIGLDRPWVTLAAGLAKGQLVQIERGNVTVSARTLARIAGALRTSPDLIRARAERLNGVTS